MILKFLLSLTILLLGNLASSEKFSFEGYKLIDITPKIPIHVELLGKWELNQDFDVWGRIKTIEESVKVLLSPVAYLKYSIYFNLFKIPYTIVDDNIQNKIEEQERSMDQKRNERNIVGKFARYSEIQNYIDDIVANNPEIASSFIAGKTYENRNLKVLVLKTSNSKRNIWLDCGIHAREWIAPSTCIYIIDKLVKGYTSADSEILSLLNYFEFHILPLVNPDGYEYSHTTYRLWRKNRKPNTGSSCIGTDLNRNFGYQWRTGGSSTDPCSDGYAGPKADSELETQAIESYINRFPNRWDSFLTFHTYGQWWFTTWGYTTNLPNDYTELVAKAKIGSDAIKAVYGSEFVYGSSARILYIASGGSEDWASGVANIKYAYCLELRPGQRGVDSNYGFTLPEDRAPKAGEETFAGIKAFLLSIKQ